MIKKIGMLTLLAAIFATSAYAAATRESAEKALKAAIDANNKVAEMGFEWRDTKKKLLTPAEKAIKAGDFDKAIALANTAKSHAELGMKQAGLSETTNPSLLIK